MVWFISDTHYAHKNIIRGTSEWADKSGCRDFDKFSEHNQWLIDLVNKNVKPNDVLWHLGDWSFGGEQRIMEFRSAIRCGDIHLILGNHDHHIAKVQDSPERYGFHTVRHYAEIQLGKTQVVVCHYPLESWINMERGAYHLHGHCHGNMRQMEGRYDVGVDTPYGPISIDELRTLPSNKRDKRHKNLTGGNVFGT